MNVNTFILYLLLTTLLSCYSKVYCRSAYENLSYNNDRDDNLSLLARQKKRLSNEDTLHDNVPEEYERELPVFEGQRYRQFDSDGFAHHDNRLDKMSNFEEKKREYYDANNAKDASIEVILDPRAKKAVAVVENTPTGQAMYDLTAWKSNKKENSAYDSDQYNSGTQEQVVNLVYPAERNDRKYPNSFDSNSDYSEKVKLGFKDNVHAEDSHKKKRNVDAKKSDKDAEKRSTQEKSKRKSESKIDDIKQNECPPHNTPASAKSETNEKVQTVKRETSQWSQEQLNALKNSLAHVKNNEGEVQNLKNILSNMGLIEQSQLEKKRETVKSDSEVKILDKREENKEMKLNNELKSNMDDEDLNQDNIMLKRNGRDINKTEQEEINSAPKEPEEKREAAENNLEEDGNDESLHEKIEVKRSSNDAESINLENKNDININEETQSRNKRQNTEKNQKLNKDENTDKENTAAVVNDVKKYDTSKNYAKRETNSDSSTEIRKSRENQETDEEYEKRMESQIQAKIDAIKEKVKREILEEQLKRRYKRNQNIDFENLSTNIRKRRQAKEDISKCVINNNAANNGKFLANSLESQSKVVRRKRANILPEKQMVYRAYQTDQDEEAEDDSEFDDNGYDGRMYVEKRQAEDENDYYDPVRKREVDNYLRQYFPEPRNRRSNNEGYGEESNAFHGSRRATKNKSSNNKQKEEEYNSKTNDNEYFGSLPQTYNGELNRYKRVKRDNPYK